MIAVVMGSKSDWPTLSKGVEWLEAMGIAPLVRVVSAHRTPARLVEFARGAEDAGIKVIIAGAGGAAHLPGMIASMTHLPVLGVPMNVNSLNGMDALLSIVQMPKGVPVGTLAIGEAGAVNAAILAAQIVALSDAALAARIKAWRQAQTDGVPDDPR